MNLKSIKFKVIITILLSLGLGACGILFLLNNSYKNNIKLIAEQSVTMSQETYKNLEKNDVKMMSAALESIMSNPGFQSAFISKDRQKLLSLCQPLHKKLKQDYRIQGWVFYNPEPANTFFLRVHKPEQFGDVNDRVTFTSAVETKEIASGKELGNHAYSLRAVAPYYANGKLIGYMELNEDIDHFFDIMKKQTGNEFGLLIDKNALKEKKWASMRKEKNLKNNWADLPGTVVATNTAKDEGIVDFQGNVQEIPDKGKVLEEVKKDGSVFIRGIFPLYDASQKKIGGVFVLRDITSVYNEMKAMQNKAILSIILLMVLITIVMILIFDKLIIKRLNNIVTIATRVVGGDYNTQIAASADDEIGKFESLFEQFRTVFVSLVNDLEEKNKQ